MPLPMFLTGQSPNEHELCLGQTGCGKSTLLNAIALDRGHRSFVIIVDPKGSWTNVYTNWKQIRWDSRVIGLRLDPINAPQDFDGFVEYLFQMYSTRRYRDRILVIVDEADLFCRYCPDSINRLIGQGRQYFDILFASRKPSDMLTHGKYVCLSQARRVRMFDMRQSDVRCVENNFSGKEFQPDDIAWIKQPYHYLIVDSVSVRRMRPQGYTPQEDENTCQNAETTVPITTDASIEEVTPNVVSNNTQNDSSPTE
jgi:energy-coupling factor transporter ATP-binding protein EcfA2